MKLAYLFIAFTAGMAFQKWDAKYGDVYGKTAGRWTRTHIFGLPPINTESKDQTTDKGR